MWSTAKLGILPLRIAFFGSDAFSVASLARLQALKQKNPGVISQLDVVTRSIKPTGRNLKNFVDVPVGAFATAQNLHVWRADSGADILGISHQYDLAVAVSYGRLIPGEFLSKLTFGGINVHPSLLPTYSGSSPIQYALMDDAKVTGVTVQTLHPTKFDRGSIIKQSSPIHINNDDNFALLLRKLAEVGADLLENVILSGEFVNPPGVDSKHPFSLASKITPGRSEIKWEAMTSRQIRRLSDALGPLHTYKWVDIVKKKQRVRDFYKVILDDIEEAGSTSLRPGEFKLADEKLLIGTSDGALTVGKIKLQYCGYENAATFIKLLRKRVGETDDVFESRTDQNGHRL